MRIIIYIIINLFLFSSWYILLFRKKHHLSFIDRLIGTFILGLTQIVFTEMLLGVLFKRLFVTPLFLFNVSISVVVLVLAIYTYKKEREQKDEIATSRIVGTRNDKQRSQNGKFRGFLEQNILEDIIHEFKDETIRFFNIIKRDIMLLCIFILFFISVCYMIFLGYLFPSYTWDALWYHLPIVGYIMQSGAIEENPAPFFINLFINIFPKNMELFFLWNTIFLKSDVITDLSQLLFTITGVFTIYSIAIKLKIKEEYAIYSSLLFFFTPIVILQSTTNYIDIAVSVLFLIAINFLMYDSIENYTNPFHLSPSPEKKVLILLSGLTTGILLGSKGSGPLFVVVLVAMVVIQKFVRHFFISSKNYSLFTVHYSLYFIVPVFLMGGYWYIKNWVLYNNPVYPMSVSLFNITLFKGVYGGIIDPAPDVISQLFPLTRPFYVWLERVAYYLYDSRLSGFGPIWFILFLPSMIFSLIYATKEKKYNCLFVSIILIIAFLIHPRNWNTRYVIFIVGLGAVSFGLVLDYFNERERALKIISLLFAVYTFFTANSPCIMPWKIKEFIRLPVRERTIARHTPFNIDLHARQEYGYWIWISNNILKGDTLAYAFEPLFLSPLWNRGFSNKIVYIKSETYNEWLNDLKKNNVTHVLIRQNSTEDKWINKARKLMNSFWWVGASHPEKFKIVYSDENYKIMRFIK